ncbi:hypothetical protein [Bacillus phage BSTP8]|nr:hypothetical protein BSTP5_030 [Bacillus phage BSTP5]QRI44380.1 hypothetical protein [Bacillus phage BSTP8]QRI44387.1 hypothetical protein [Bacillus phage BSTP10]QRI44517.1 hypothetical protein [Bacillus phage BSTP12]
MTKTISKSIHKSPLRRVLFFANKQIIRNV